MAPFGLASPCASAAGALSDLGLALDKSNLTASSIERLENLRLFEGQSSDEVCGGDVSSKQATTGDDVNAKLCVRICTDQSCDEEKSPACSFFPDDFEEEKEQEEVGCSRGQDAKFRWLLAGLPQNAEVPLGIEGEWQKMGEEEPLEPWERVVAKEEFRSACSGTPTGSFRCIPTSSADRAQMSPSVGEEWVKLKEEEPLKLASIDGKDGTLAQCELLTDVPLEVGAQGPQRMSSSQTLQSIGNNAEESEDEDSQCSATVFYTISAEDDDRLTPATPQETLVPPAQRKKWLWRLGCHVFRSRVMGLSRAAPSLSSEGTGSGFGTAFVQRLKSFGRAFRKRFAALLRRTG